MKILEVDQWHSTGDITKFSMGELEGDAQLALGQIKGGDSKAAKVIFGGHLVIREVSETDSPSVGTVWFRQGQHGKLEKYKSNYDSSG